MAMGLVSSIVVSGQFVLLSKESLNWLRYSGVLLEFIAMVKNLTQLALTSLFSLRQNRQTYLGLLLWRNCKS